MSNPGFREARAFLEGEGMLYETYDLDALVKHFLKEMDAGLKGKMSSLAMIPTYYTTPLVLPEEERVLVIDAGGTSLRRGIIQPALRDPVIESFSRTSMPGTGEEVDKERFVEEIADFIIPLLPSLRRIGFCFSYPIINGPDRDARVVSMTKELKIRGVIDAYIGRELFEHLGRKGWTNLSRPAVLNDTTAVFLAGWHRGRDDIQRPGGDLHMGFILGTGANSCYQEPNANVRMAAGGSKTGEQIINMESGGFAHIPKGSADEDMHGETMRKDYYTLEKMCAGAYLGPLFQAVLRRASSAGVFGKTSVRLIMEAEGFTTMDLGDLLSGDDTAPSAGLFAGSADLETARGLAALLVRRAALVAAIPPAAIAERSFSRKGAGSYSGMLMSSEGSTLFRIPGLKEMIEDYVCGYVEKRWGIRARIREVRNGSLLGAGMAAVSQAEVFSSST